MYKLVKNSQFNVKVRLVKSKIPSFSGLVRTIIARTRDINNLKNDLKNSARHIFGDHNRCRRQVCSRKQNKLITTSLYRNLQIFLVRLLKFLTLLGRLSQNVTTNYAERYMSVISKFTGGKRTNLVQRGIYESRCVGAGLAYNMGSSFHKLSTKLNKHFLEQFCAKRTKKKVCKKKIKKNIGGQQDMD